MKTICCVFSCLLLWMGCKQEKTTKTLSTPSSSSTTTLPSVDDDTTTFVVKAMHSKAVCPGKNIRLVACFFNNSPEKEKKHYFYNKKNQLDSIAVNNTGTKYIYKNNQLIETWYYDAPKEPVSEKHILIYNVNHQLEKVTYFLRNDKNKTEFKLQITYTFEYNQNGNLIKKSYCYGSNLCYTHLYEWKKGNMILQKDYQNNELEHEWRMQYDKNIHLPALEIADLIEPQSYNNIIKSKAKDYTGGLCLAAELPRYLYKYNKDGLPTELKRQSILTERFEYECF